MKPYISCLPTLLPTYLPAYLRSHYHHTTVSLLSGNQETLNHDLDKHSYRRTRVYDLRNWICQKCRRDNMWNAHIQSFRLSRRMRICFHLILFLLSAKPISVQWNGHRAMHVALGGTASKTKRNVTIHSLINIVTTINWYTYAAKHEGTILYSAVSETDGHICIFQCNVTLRIKE